jgi:hypothetical protein
MQGHLPVLLQCFCFRVSYVSTGSVLAHPAPVCSMKGESSRSTAMMKTAPAVITKEIFFPLDAVQKPYDCESKFKRQRRLATTTLLGLAPVRSARASAATTVHPQRPPPSPYVR